MIETTPTADHDAIAELRAGLTEAPTDPGLEDLPPIFEQFTTLVPSNLHCFEVAEIEDAPTAQYVGSLTEYMSAFRSGPIWSEKCAVPVMFYSRKPFEEKDFILEADDEEESAIDLRTLDESLKRFEVHLGQDAHIRLSVILKDAAGQRLNYDLFEPWALELAAEKLRIEMEFALAKEQRAAEAEAAFAEERETITANLAGLIADPEFVAIKTQRAMKAYALRKIPDARKLDDFEERIVELWDQIEIGRARKGKS